MKALYTGFYSAESARNFGSVIWADSSGKEYEVTSVSLSGEGTHWADEVTVSHILEKFIRQNRRGANEFYNENQKNIKYYRYDAEIKRNKYEDI